MSLVDLGKRLLDAAKLGQTDEVRTLMSNGAPFTTDWLGTSPLHYAVAYGHSDTAEVLLRAGISRDARTKVDRTPLHIAAQEGHVDIVDMLLRNGADIEAKDMLRMTPLHWAVEKCHLQVIEVLIDHSADISCENKFDRSPVDIALESGRNDIADMLQMSRENTVEISCEQEVSTTTDVISTELDPITLTPISQSVDNPSMAAGDALMMPQPLQIIVNQNENCEENANRCERDVTATDQNNTAVLATLAALAEATAPLDSSTPTCTSAVETLNWLESQRITMISESDASSMRASGHTFTLTEAGKLALNIVSNDVREECEVREGNVKQETVLEEEEERVTDDNSSASIEQQNLLTVVSATDEIAVTEQSHTECTDTNTADDCGDEPVSKRLLIDDTQPTATSPDSLRLQLEEAQRQAALFKQQLLHKQREADDYKKQLTKISAKPSDAE